MVVGASANGVSAAALDSTLLQPSRKVSVTLDPGRTKYFHLDVSASPGAQPSLNLRLVRDGGDPVLMASASQWPVVDLDAKEDMVRAHFCAFDAFHADAKIHTDPSQPLLPGSPSRGVTPRSLPTPPSFCPPANFHKSQKGRPFLKSFVIWKRGEGAAHRHPH